MVAVTTDAATTRFRRRFVTPLGLGAALVAGGLGTVGWAASRTPLVAAHPAGNPAAARLRGDSVELNRIAAALAASERSIAQLAARKLKGLPAGSGSPGFPSLPVLAPLTFPAVHAVTGASGVP